MMLPLNSDLCIYVSALVCVYVKTRVYVGQWQVRKFVYVSSRPREFFPTQMRHSSRIARGVSNLWNGRALELKNSYEIDRHRSIRNWHQKELFVLRKVLNAAKLHQHLSYWLWLWRRLDAILNTSLHLKQTSSCTGLCVNISAQISIENKTQSRWQSHSLVGNIAIVWQMYDFFNLFFSRYVYFRVRMNAVFGVKLYCSRYCVSYCSIQVLFALMISRSPGKWMASVLNAQRVYDVIWYTRQQAHHHGLSNSESLH